VEIAVRCCKLRTLRATGSLLLSVFQWFEHSLVVVELQEKAWYVARAEHTKKIDADNNPQPQVTLPQNRNMRDEQALSYILIGPVMHPFQLQAAGGPETSRHSDKSKSVVYRKYYGGKQRRQSPSPPSVIVIGSPYLELLDDLFDNY
jgi:hypothetical protein